MALIIEDDEADRLARALAQATGETVTEAIVIALRERLERERGRRAPGVAARLRWLTREVSGLPVLDDRPAEQLVGYDEHGVTS